MSACVQKWVSLANLYYNFLGIDVITKEHLTLEGPPFPHGQHFLHSCNFILYRKCVDLGIQLACHVSIFERLWTKHYSVLDKITLDKVNLDILNKMNCSVTEIIFRRNLNTSNS